MKRIIFSYLTLSLGLSTLTGCSTYQDNFDCPAGKGVGCHSISEVNEMVDQGAFDSKTSPFKGLKGGEEGAKPLVFIEAEPRLISLDPSHQDTLSPVWRVPEQTMEVWIKGYIDEGGHYHHDGKVNMVVHPASWQVRP